MVVSEDQQTNVSQEMSYFPQLWHEIRGISMYKYYNKTSSMECILSHRNNKLQPYLSLVFPAIFAVVGVPFWVCWSCATSTLGIIIRAASIPEDVSPWVRYSLKHTILYIMLWYYHAVLYMLFVVLLWLLITVIILILFFFMITII